MRRAALLVHSLFIRFCSAPAGNNCYESLTVSLLREWSCKTESDPQVGARTREPLCMHACAAPPLKPSGLASPRHPHQIRRSGASSTAVPLPQAASKLVRPQLLHGFCMHPHSTYAWSLHAFCGTPPWTFLGSLDGPRLSWAGVGSPSPRCREGRAQDRRGKVRPA